MEQKVCFDSDVIIDHINQKGISRLETFLEKGTNLFVSSVSIFELGLRTTNREKAESFLRLFKVVDFDEPSAMIAARITRELDKKGTPLEFRDVFIAATCISNNCTLVTNNKRDFERIKDLRMA
ncbi:MAG: type II toxin-antitoxin system VapC family toxin [archaeon]